MSDESGSAALEFIAVGVLLLVPLLYLAIALGTIQEQTLGAETAARQAARAIADAPDAEAAASRGDAVLADIVEEYGIDPDTVDISVRCVPATPPCPTAGATVVVTVATRARLPLVPGVVGLDEAAAIPIEAQSMQKVSRQWSGS
jgi:Flp pilus assembly protein TadG